MRGSIPVIVEGGTGGGAGHIGLSEAQTAARRPFPHTVLDAEIPNLGSEAADTLLRRNRLLPTRHLPQGHQNPGLTDSMDAVLLIC